MKKTMKKIRPDIEKAASAVLRDPRTSKKSKVEAGLSLTQASKKESQE